MSDQYTPPASFLRLTEILRNKKPGYDGFLPMSEATWHHGIKLGCFPKPVKLGRAALYRKADIDDLMERIARGELASVNPRDGGGAIRGRPPKAKTLPAPQANSVGGEL